MQKMVHFLNMGSKNQKDTKSTLNIARVQSLFFEDDAEFFELRLIFVGVFEDEGKVVDFGRK